MKQSLSDFLKRIAPPALRIMRLRRRAGRILTDWREPLGKGWDGKTWENLRDRAQADSDAPRVLMATTVGGHLAAVQFDAVIAVALTLRGAKVSFLLCDAALPACMSDMHDWYPDRRRFLRDTGPRDVCKTCLPVGEPYLAGLGLPVVRLSSLFSEADRRVAYEAADAAGLDGLKDWRYLDLPVGEHALAGALRFHARADLEGVPEREAILRAYMRAGALSGRAAESLGREHPYDVMVAHHGIYVPQGVWAAAARKQGRRVVTWNPGYRTNSFVLSEHDSYHKTMITEDTSLWEDTALTPSQRAGLHAYLKQRRTGEGDWISFGSRRAGKFEDYVRELGLDPSRPTIAALTSVMWDAQLHYESNAFASQLDWLDATIAHVRKRGDINLIIRIHPAEVTGMIPSRQPVAAHVARKHGKLPGHIAVVAPESTLNTYALTDGCDCALVYSTKTGIELSAVGTPVVVAGEAWIRNKGFSIDASSPAEYEDILRRLPIGARLTEAEQERAERYAYHFFFRRMVQLPGFEKRAGWPPYATMLDDLAPIAPGADANLDMVCERIVEGGPFLAERVS